MDIFLLPAIRGYIVGVLMNVAKPTEDIRHTGKSVDNFTCAILIFGKEISPGRHRVESGSNLKLMRWLRNWFSTLV